MRPTILVLLVGAFAGSVTPLTAQTTGQLQVGARVRLVSLEGKRTVGRLAGFTDDSVSLVSSAHAVAFDQLSKVEVSGGKRRLRGAMIGGALGLVIGAVSGGLAGSALYREARSDCDNVVCVVVADPHIGAAAGVYAGGALGLLTGALVGSMVKNERWVDVSGLTTATAKR
jgi:hypothetical protein